MTEDEIKVRLEITAAERRVQASLTFVNNSSSEEAHIDKINGCLNGKIENDVFTITSDGKEIEYVGKLTKRSAPSVGDFASVPPKGRLIAHVRVDEVYSFLPGTHTYKAVYSAFHTYPGDPDLLELESNEATFKFTR